MRDTKTVSSHAVIVVKTSRLVLANRNFMPAVDSPTLLAVAQAAEQLGVPGNHQALALVVLVANILRPPVRAVDVQPPYHLFLVKTVPSIVTNAFRSSAPRVALVVKSRAVMAAIATTVALEAAVSVIALIVATVVSTVSAGKLKSNVLS
jgi:hypothetical protein